MIRRPPRSTRTDTLFPYTTLFRSVLYRDIWEINPPLWFWSAVPIQYAADLAGVSPFHILLPVTIAMGALSAILLGNLPGTLPPLRRMSILVLAFGLYNRSDERRVGKKCVGTYRSRWRQDT